MGQGARHDRPSIGRAVQSGTAGLAGKTLAVPPPPLYATNLPSLYPLKLPILRNVLLAFCNSQRCNSAATSTVGPCYNRKGGELFCSCAHAVVSYRRKTVSNTWTWINK